jgi:hypothetical protein
MTLRDLMRLRTRAHLVGVVDEYAVEWIGVALRFDATSKSVIQKALNYASAPC